MQSCTLSLDISLVNVNIKENKRRNDKTRGFIRLFIPGGKKGRRKRGEGINVGRNSVHFSSSLGPFAGHL